LSGPTKRHRYRSQKLFNLRLKYTPIHYLYLLVSLLRVIALYGGLVDILPFWINRLSFPLCTYFRFYFVYLFVCSAWLCVFVHTYANKTFCVVQNWVHNLFKHTLNFIFQNLLSIFAFTTFAVDPTLTQNRLQLSFILTLAGISFRFVTNQNIPKISYLTHLVSFNSRTQYISLLV